MRVVKSLLRTFLLITLIFVLAIIAELFTPLKQLTDYFNQNPQPYKAITIGTSILGWILMAGGIAYGLWRRGKATRDDEESRLLENGDTSPTMYRSFRGPSKVREFRTEVTFKEIKEAWHDGNWNNSEWLPIFLSLLALIFIAFGMFGFFFVIGAPLVKLVCGGALAYATVRTIWAFGQA
jgi:hypothetical protein